MQNPTRNETNLDWHKVKHQLFWEGKRTIKHKGENHTKFSNNIAKKTNTWMTILTK